MLIVRVMLNVKINNKIIVKCQSNLHLMSDKNIEISKVKKTKKQLFKENSLKDLIKLLTNF